MSFSADVKQELCRAPLSRKCCAQAEAYGILLYCNTFSSGEIRIITESDALAQRLPSLFKKAFQITFDKLPDGEGKHIFLIREPEKLAAVQQTFGGDQRALALHINFGVLEDNCCRISFLRGAFLSGGSVTDPQKGYHLELSTSHQSVSREMVALMRDLDLEPKDAPRKGNAVIYFKQSDRIEDFLTSIGAPISAMEVMNAKLEKDLRGSVNRRVNCDAANLDKAVEAAQGQIEDQNIGLLLQKLQRTNAVAGDANNFVTAALYRFLQLFTEILIAVGNQDSDSGIHMLLSCRIDFNRAGFLACDVINLP